MQDLEEPLGDEGRPSDVMVQGRTVEHGQESQVPVLNNSRQTHQILLFRSSDVNLGNNFTAGVEAIHHL